MTTTSTLPRVVGHRRGLRGFTLAELLVVIGIIALLISILLPPLRAAHRQAMDTRCKLQEQQLGLALQSALVEYKYYPIWDDGGSPVRYTWIDVLIQRRLLGNARAGYCPQDPQPGMLSTARGEHFLVSYPGSPGHYGIDYSYGIGVPLSAAGWFTGSPGGSDGESRRLEDHDRYPAQRVLAGDANWSTIYNLSGHQLDGHNWNFPAWYDNMVDWRHHGPAANLLFQDGHVARLQYTPGYDKPVDTTRQFVWYSGEPLDVGPPDQHGRNYYPDSPPVNLETGESVGGYPSEMAPSYYTYNSQWTQIHNK